MRFKLKDIQANPFRHIERYPIRLDKVAALRESIQTTSFWDNLVARVKDGKPEIAYGHHRIVALRAEYAPNREVELIVRDLDNLAMLQIMARENMEEWGSSAVVEQETVRAAVEAYGAGEISLDRPESNADPRKFRYAPGFVQGEAPHARVELPYTSASLAKIIGWDVVKVRETLAALELIEEGTLQELDFSELSTKQAVALVEEARLRKRRGEAEAKDRLRESKAAEEMAAKAEKARIAAEDARAKARQEQREAERRAKEADDARSRKRAEREAELAKEEADRQAEEVKIKAAEKRYAEKRQAESAALAKKATEKAVREAAVAGRAVGKHIRAGGGYRDAKVVAAAALDPRPKSAKPYIDKGAEALTVQLNRLLKSGDLFKKLEELVQEREYLSPDIRDQLAERLRQVATRATTFAERLESEVPKQEKAARSGQRALTA